MGGQLQGVRSAREKIISQRTAIFIEIENLKIIVERVNSSFQDQLSLNAKELKEAIDSKAKAILAFQLQLDNKITATEQLIGILGLKLATISASNAMMKEDDKIKETAKKLIVLEESLIVKEKNRDSLVKSNTDYCNKIDSITILQS